MNSGTLGSSSRWKSLKFADVSGGVDKSLGIKKRLLALKRR